MAEYLLGGLLGLLGVLTGIIYQQLARRINNCISRELCNNRFDMVSKRFEEQKESLERIEQKLEVISQKLSYLNGEEGREFNIY